MGTIKSFIKETLAHIVGDTDTVISERNYRKAKAIVGGQIHSLNYAKVMEEVELERAEKKLLAAKYPGSEINEDTYLSNIAHCAEGVADAKEALESTLKAIKFSEDLLVEFDKDVEPAEKQ